MILEITAKYFSLPDSIQVAVLVMEDDFTSAAPKVTNGTVQILQGESVMFSETFDRQHVVLWTDEDVPEDRGQFYFFLHHPPVQQYMQARVAVTLQNDSVITQTVQVDATSIETDPSVWQNPALAGRATINFPKDPSFPTRPLDGSDADYNVEHGP